jgi:hypothetical protein
MGKRGDLAAWFFGELDLGKYDAADAESRAEKFRKPREWRIVP